MSLSDKEVQAVAKAVLNKESQVIKSLVEQVGDVFVEIAHKILACEGHVLVTGLGTSHSVALRLAHLLCCCGTPALFIHPADSLHGGAGAVTNRDVLLAMSKGGETAEVNKLVEIAKKRGCFVIGVTENLDSSFAQLSDVTLQVKAYPQVDPYGMIATASSLANAAMGDALCVTLLKLRGYTREDFGETHPGGAVGRKLAVTVEDIS